jgi:hypothetical protein
MTSILKYNPAQAHECGKLLEDHLAIFPDDPPRWCNRPRNHENRVGDEQFCGWSKAREGLPAPERDASWIITSTGRKFWPLDPRPDDICIEDIAHGLSMCCRYAGQCPKFYSVAEHSVYVAEWMLDGRSRRALVGLLHDASEAYLGDMTRPVKRRMPEYQAAEKRLQRCIHERFGLLDIAENPELVGQVKHYDDAMLITERLQFFKPETHPGAAVDFSRWQTQGERLQQDIACLDWKAAKKLFLKSFAELSS